PRMPNRYWSRLSTTSLSARLGLRSAGGGGRGRCGGGGGHPGRRVAVDRGRRRRGVARLAQGGVERRLPLPVAVALLQLVVDEGAEGVVAPLQADAVGLGAELVADHLEGRGGLGGEAQEDGGVGGFGVGG